MRVATGLVFSMPLLAAMPSEAQNVASPRVPISAAITPGIGQIERHSVRVSENFRVRVDVAGTSPGPSNTVRDRVHQRVAGSMIDFYPLDGKGFHLSAGNHLYQARNPGSADKRTRGLLDQATGGGRGAPRPGLRSTPAATVGYTGRLDGKTDLGLEMGALKGRSYGTVRDMETPGERRGAAVNPMVNLVIGHRF